MFDRIDARLPTPLYTQIAQAVRAAIGAGDLRPGDGLPSVRALAAQLRVNPATVVQAYRELESDMLIEMRQGAGSFVRDVPPDRREGERHAAFRRLVGQALDEAVRMSLPPHTVRQLVSAELARVFG
ncbi:MAG: GntR family transcriptional regulator [Gemmatimonadota bacterium]|jgi:GntR family transcriptional regulator